MGKIIGKFSLIMFGNLFAFLSVGYILDLLFQTGARFKIACLILSVFSLTFISMVFFKKALRDIEEISGKEETDNIT